MTHGGNFFLQQKSFSLFSLARCLTLLPFSSFYASLVLSKKIRIMQERDGE
jgi:hypothetical protein